jgi:ubiquinone biosynthesis protein COQ4
MNLDEVQLAEVMKKFGHLVAGPYGDFKGIADMAQEIMTPEATMLVARTLMSSPTGMAALGTQPRLGAVDLAALAALPEGTLGHRYGHHMLDNGYQAPPILPVSDPRSYFIAHFVEVHDIWHVVTGFGTDKAGEIGLQGFYVAQVHPSTAFLALLAKNLLKTALQDLELADVHMRYLVAGWLLGKQTQPLFGVDWKRSFEQPLASVRAGFGIASDSPLAVLPS